MGLRREGSDSRTFGKEFSGKFIFRPTLSRASSAALSIRTMFAILFFLNSSS